MIFSPTHQVFPSMKTSSPGARQVVVVAGMGVVSDMVLLYLYFYVDIEPMNREVGAEPYFRGFETKKKSPLTESNRRHLDDRDVYPNSYSPMRGRVEKPIYQLS